MQSSDSIKVRNN